MPGSHLGVPGLVPGVAVLVLPPAVSRRKRSLAALSAEDLASWLAAKYSSLQTASRRRREQEDRRW
jgi:hypothetical protein